MFEREQLLDEFDQMLRRRRESVEQMKRLLTQVADQRLRTRLEEMRDHTERHAVLAERLMEILG